MPDRPRKTDKGAGQRNENVLANAAIFYYREGLTQNEIAKRMGVSRATVVNYLRLARELNIVDIRIKGASFTSSKLSKDLREKFNLDDVYVAGFNPDEDNKSKSRSSDLNRYVARVGAMALYDILKPNDVLGVSWGETIQYLVAELPKGSIERVTVCQMIGSMKSPLLQAAESCAIILASKIGAECNTLHAPAILSTAELARALRREPIIKSQLEKFSEFTRTLFSVGNCDANTHVVQSGIASRKEFEWYKKQNAVGVICGRFIDSDGNHIKGDMDDRIIGVTLEELKGLKSGILVAAGKEKRAAILATLAGGYVSHLVIDETTAKSLL